MATFLSRKIFGTSDGGRDSQSIVFFTTPGIELWYRAWR